MSQDDLLTRLRNNDPDTWRELHEQFAPGLMAVAGRHLRAIRGQLSAEDVYNSVLKSFWVQVNKGNVAVDEWDGVGALLWKITICKCRKRLRYYRQQRRDTRRAEPLASEPGTVISPEESVELEDFLTRLMKYLEDPTDREKTEFNQRVAALLLSGYSPEEIVTGTLKSGLPLPEDARLPPGCQTSLATVKRRKRELEQLLTAEFNKALGLLEETA